MRRSAEGHESGDCNSYDCPRCEYEADLEPLYDAALPVDAPGAWIRRAIESLEDDQ